jgi:hypothetical protein
MFRNGRYPLEQARAATVNNGARIDGNDRRACEGRVSCQALAAGGQIGRCGPQHASAPHWRVRWLYRSASVRHRPKRYRSVAASAAGTRSTARPFGGRPVIHSSGMSRSRPPRPGRLARESAIGAGLTAAGPPSGKISTVCRVTLTLYRAASSASANIDRDAAGRSDLVDGIT